MSPGRHYFDCGGTILAVFDPPADGDDFEARPNSDDLYFAVPDLDATFERARQTGGDPRPIQRQPWGERSFYMNDPFGNPLCFVDETTTFTGR